MAIDDPIDTWLTTPIPEKLWHYTSIPGFYGIVASKRIWATDIRFLNDKQELVHVRKFIDQVLNALPTDRPGEFQLKAHITTLINRAPSRQFFTVSFSTKEDQLSQWRGYSYNTTGVSLGFDLTKLRPPANMASPWLHLRLVFTRQKRN